MLKSAMLRAALVVVSPLDTVLPVGYQRPTSLMPLSDIDPPDPIGYMIGKDFEPAVASPSLSDTGFGDGVGAVEPPVF